VNPSKSLFGLAVAAALAATTVHPFAFGDDEPEAAAAASPVVHTVMTKLDNPRGIALGPDGSVFVAEAGTGGREKGPCSPGTQTCYGHTGAVTRLWKGVQERVVTGLPSVAFPAGNSARGPHDIAVHGMGNARVTLGLEYSAATRDARGWVGSGWLADVPANVLMAPADQLRPKGWSLDVDMAAFEALADPDPRIVESDPYGIVADEDGYVVVDASGNSLVRVPKRGDPSVLAVFPTRPQRTWDSVPTGVAIGPDGAFYVGELVGFGVTPPSGEAKVYRVVPGEAPTVFCSGFNRVIDIGFDTDGSLWVLQHSTQPQLPLAGGVLWRVVPPPLESADRSCPERQQIDTGVALDGPTAFALAPDAIYISNRGARAAVGEVLRIER